MPCAQKPDQAPQRHSLPQTYADETIVIHPHQLALSRVDSDPDRTPVTIQIDPSNNSPVSQMIHPQKTEVIVEALTTAISMVSNLNINLSEPQKELLC